MLSQPARSSTSVGHNVVGPRVSARADLAEQHPVVGGADLAFVLFEGRPRNASVFCFFRLRTAKLLSPRRCIPEFSARAAR